MTDRISSRHRNYLRVFSSVYVPHMGKDQKKYSQERKRLGIFTYSTYIVPQYKGSYVGNDWWILWISCYIQEICALNEEWIEADKLRGTFQCCKQLIGLPTCAANTCEAVELGRGSKKCTVVRMIKTYCTGWRLWVWMPKNEKPCYEWREGHVILKSLNKDLNQTRLTYVCLN